MNKFKTLFNVVSKENADATTIPVVLELDVKPAEGQADVAADPAASEPAAAPATDAPVDSGTENLDTTAVKIDEVVTQEPAAATVADAPAAAPAAQPAAPAAPVQPAQEPVASEPVAEPAVVEEPVEVSVEDEVALAEAEAEKNELVNEAEVVDDTIEKVESDVKDIGETLEANDKIIAEGGEDQINAANVAIATQSLELRLERLGLSLSDLSSSANITKETFLAKENGGLGLKPSEVLRSLHNDFAREDGILDKMKAGGKALWDAIVAAVKKIFEIIKNLLPNQKAQLIKMAEQLRKSDVVEADISMGKIAPAFDYANVHGGFSKLMELTDAGIKATIEFNNIVVKAINNMDDKSQLEEGMVYINPFTAMPNNPFGKGRIIAVHRKKVVLWVDKLIETQKVEETDKKAKIKKVDLLKSIEDLANRFDEKKSKMDEFKAMISNMEKYQKIDDSKIKAFLGNYYIKKLYQTVIGEVMKTYSEIGTANLMMAKEMLASGNKQDNK